LFNITGFTTNSYLLLTYLLASIPLPVNNFVRFTSISFFMPLTSLSRSRSRWFWSRSHTSWSQFRSRSHCFMVSLTSQQQSTLSLLF